MRQSLFSLLALAAALTVSCNKEQIVDNPVDQKVPTHPVTIKGSIIGTKTAYANEKTFSWLAGDKISVMEDLDGTVKFNEFTATSEGATTDFEGKISDGASLGQWAVYPSSLTPAVNDGVLSVNLPYYYELNDNPLSVLPLVGQKQEGDSYKFISSMGIVKFTLTNVPETAGYVFLYTGETVVAGGFNVDAEGVIKIGNQSTGEANSLVMEVVPSADNTVEAYLPVPVGALPAGCEIRLYATDGATLLFSQQTVKEIPVVRNTVTEVAPLTLPDSGLTLEDILGDYTLTGTSPWADDDGNYDVTSTIKISENPYADLSDYGNVIITGNLLGVPINNYPVFAMFNPVDATLSISAWVPIYRNSSYVEPTEGEEEDPNNFEAIYIYHFVYASNSISGSSEPLVFQFSDANQFASSFAGSSYLGLLMSNNYIFDMFNPVSGTRIQEEVGGDDGGEVVVEGAPAKKAPRLAMPGLKEKAAQDLILKMK